MSGLSVAGSRWSSGSAPGFDLLDVMRDAQAHDELEGVGQRGGVRRRERARRGRRAQALGRRGAGDARRHARPAGEVDDRHEAPVLEVQPPAVLAGVLDDQAAQEAGGRAEGEREARELAQEGRMPARVAQAPRRARPRCGCPTPGGCRRRPRRGSAPAPASGPRASSAPLGARTPASGRAAGWRPWCPSRRPAGRRRRGPRRRGGSTASA